MKNFLPRLLRPRAPTMTSAGERIAKRIAAAGICSRREAEGLIAEGRVKVNGRIISSPALNVTAEDAVLIDNVPLAPPRHTRDLWALHKPSGYITSTRDPAGIPTVFSLLPPDLPRLISVGRLDVTSEGLLLFTTSGALARALELPKNALPRTYRVRVGGIPGDAQLAELARGMTIDGIRYRGAKVVLDQTQSTGRNRWLTVTLIEGKNREIRRLFGHLNLPVSRLIRTHYAGIALGDLPPGHLRKIPAALTAKLAQKLGVA